jgi:hypothetical protein
LGRDLKAIRRALREEPPPQVAGLRFRPAAARWAPAALAAAALAIVMVWQGMRIGRPSVPPPNANQEIWSLLEGVSADLFSLNQAIAEELGVETADPDDLVAALEGDWSAE